MSGVSGGGNLSTDTPVRRQKHFQPALQKFQRFTGSLWAGTLNPGGVMRGGRANVVTTGTFLGHVCPAVSCPDWVGADVPKAREETGCFLWFVQQTKVVGCCPGVQALAVRGCCVVTPVEMLSIEVASVQTGAWERRDGRRSESRAWRFVDVDDLATCDAYTQPLSLWLIWRLIDRWPFQTLVDKRGKAVIPAQDWPS